jgi:hypothetical protein
MKMFGLVMTVLLVVGILVLIWKPGLSMPPARLKYPGFDNGDYLVSLDLVIKNGESSRDIKVVSTGFP